MGATTNYGNRGEWLTTIVKGALSSAFTIQNSYVIGKWPDVLPAIYLEMTNETFADGYEAPGSKDGSTDFLALVFYKAAENDGGASDMTTARNAAVHSIETALQSLENDEAITNTDPVFRHSVRAVNIVSASGELDDETRYGLTTAVITVQWSRFPI